MFGSDFNRAIAVGAAMLSIALFPARAEAASPVDGRAFPAAVNCAPDVTEPLALDRIAAVPAASKSSTILDGQVSALERMRLSQEQGSAQVEPGLWLAEAPPAAASLAPAAGGGRLASGPCSKFAVRQPDRTREPGEFLASKRLAIRRSAFDDDWRRVSRDHVSRARFERLLGPAGGNTVETLAAVNRWVNRNIAFAEDRDLFARADYWAGAGKTLELGRGDCEDIALTKMQMLLAAGVEREDMILTIARDLVRNADHAFLVVRHDGRFYLLDNATDELLDASVSQDYRPVLSFGSEQTWLHGY